MTGSKPLIARYRRMPRNSNPYIGPIIAVSIIILFFQARWMGQQKREYIGSERPQWDPAFWKSLRSKVINIYECDHCQGNGLLSDPDNPEIRTLCPICHGVGYHATRRYTEDERMCVSCGGMGRVMDEQGHARHCTRCDGRGVVVIND
jgi:hypothetical protein